MELQFKKTITNYGSHIHHKWIMPQLNNACQELKLIELTIRQYVLHFNSQIMSHNTII
jgi:hypothetical protein